MGRSTGDYGLIRTVGASPQGGRASQGDPGAEFQRVRRCHPGEGGLLPVKVRLSRTSWGTTGFLSPVRSGDTGPEVQRAVRTQAAHTAQLTRRGRPQCWEVGVTGWAWQQQCRGTGCLPATLGVRSQQASHGDRSRGCASAPRRVPCPGLLPWAVARCPRVRTLENVPRVCGSGRNVESVAEVLARGVPLLHLRALRNLLPRPPH